MRTTHKQHFYPQGVASYPQSGTLCLLKPLLPNGLRGDITPQRLATNLRQRERQISAPFTTPCKGFLKRSPLEAEGGAQGLTMTAKIRNLPARLQKTAVGIGIPHILADNAALSLRGFFVSKANPPVMGGAHGASSDAPFPVGGMPTCASSLSHHWHGGSEGKIFATGDKS